MALSKIKTASIADDAVTSAKVATGGIATIDMADGTVTSLKIADGAITPTDLSTGSPTWNSSGQVMIGGANASYATYPKFLVANTSVDIQGVIDGSSNSAANSVRNLVSLRAPFGPSPESTSNANAKWGIVFSGRPAADANYPLSLTEATTTSLAKSAAIYGYSDETSGGYNRAVGLQFWTSNEIDGNMVERLRIDRKGNVGLSITPWSWTNPTFRAIDTPTGSFYSYNNSPNFLVGISVNSYSSGGWKYAGNGYAPRLEIDSTSGSFNWSHPTQGNNTSGAGATATHAATMTLGPTGTLDVYGGINARKASSVNDTGDAASFRKQDLSGGLTIKPSLGGGQYNVLVQPGDAGIISADVNGPIVLATHNGSGIRTTQTDIKFAANNTNMGNISTNGLVVSSGFIQAPADVVGPLYFLNRPNAFDSVSAGSVLNLLPQADGGGYNSYWHWGVFSPAVNGSDNPTSWSAYRIHFRIQRHDGGNAGATFNFKVAGYMYSIGWYEVGSTFSLFVDGARGMFTAVSPWITTAMMGSAGSWGDVDGFGIKLVSSEGSVAARIGAAYIQFK